MVFTTAAADAGCTPPIITAVSTPPTTSDPASTARTVPLNAVRIVSTPFRQGVGHPPELEWIARLQCRRHLGGVRPLTRHLPFGGLFRASRMDLTRTGAPDRRICTIPDRDLRASQVA